MLPWPSSRRVAPFTVTPRRSSVRAGLAAAARSLTTKTLRKPDSVAVRRRSTPGRISGYVAVSPSIAGFGSAAGQRRVTCSVAVAEADQRLVAAAGEHHRHLGRRRAHRAVGPHAQRGVDRRPGIADAGADRLGPQRRAEGAVRLGVHVPALGLLGDDGDLPAGRLRARRRPGRGALTRGRAVAGAAAAPSAAPAAAAVPQVGAGPAPACWMTRTPPTASTRPAAVVATRRNTLHLR